MLIFISNDIIKYQITKINSHKFKIKTFSCSFKICTLFFGYVLLLRCYFHFIEDNLKYFKKRNMDLAQEVNMGLAVEGLHKTA